MNQCTKISKYIKKFQQNRFQKSAMGSLFSRWQIKLTIWIIAKSLTQDACISGKLRCLKRVELNDSGVEHVV